MALLATPCQESRLFSQKEAFFRRVEQYPLLLYGELVRWPENYRYTPKGSVGCAYAGGTNVSRGRLRARRTPTGGRIRQPTDLGACQEGRCYTGAGGPGRQILPRLLSYSWGSVRKERKLRPGRRVRKPSHMHLSVEMEWQTRGRTLHKIWSVSLEHSPEREPGTQTVSTGNRGLTAPGCRDESGLGRHQGSPSLCSGAVGNLCRGEKLGFCRRGWERTFWM